MQHNKLFYLILVVLTISISCKNESQDQVSGINTEKKYLQLEKSKWLIGKWENVTKESDSREIWTQKNDSTLFVESYVTIGKDTVFYEKIDLIQKNDSLFYIVSVRDQNKEKPVTFYCSKSTETQIVFENPKHDFPTKIEYNKINNDSIFAKIYGKKDGKEISEGFPMKKSK